MKQATSREEDEREDREGGAENGKKMEIRTL